MKQIWSAILIIFSVLVFTETSSGQVWLPGIGADTQFQRQLDAMSWDMGGSTSLTGEGYSFSFDNQFNSRLFIRDGEASNIQDENILNFSGRFDVNENVYTVGDGRSYRYTSTDVRQDYFMAGIGYQLPGISEMEVLGGFFSDHRHNEMDQGPAVGARLSSQPLPIGDWMIHPSGNIQYADIDERTYENYRGQLQAGYQTEEVTFQTRVRFARAVRESHQPSSFFNRDVTDVIEGITSDTTSAQIRLETPVYGALEGQIEMQTEFINRAFKNRMRTDEAENLFDTETRRENLDLRASVRLPLSAHRFETGLEYNVSNRNSRLLNPDDFPSEEVTRRNEVLQNATYNQSRFGLFTRNRITLAEGHQIRVDGRASILRYDTPEENVDDRDEVTYWLQLGSENEISDYLSGGLTLAGEATHQVYLQAERSLDNYWRRSLRMRPYFDWSPFNNLRIRQNFLIRANYTVHDFQLEDRPSNDRSSREFGFQTDIRWDMTSDWRIDAEASRSELRIGRLHWDSFTETPTDTLTTYNFEVMITRNIGDAQISAGGRFFIKVDYLPQTTLTTEITDEDGVTQPVSQTAPGRQVTRQFGPAVDINIPFSSGNQLRFSGWLQNQHVNRRLFTVYPDELEDAFTREEQRASTRLYPNMQLEVSFAF